MRLRLCTWASVLTLVGFLAACGDPPPQSTPPVVADPALPAAEFIGSQQCGNCHQQAYQAWQSSHHALAIQVADTATFLGSLPYTGEHAQIAASDTGINATLTTTTGEVSLPVSHTFGVHPLQQYLVDAGQGRRQTLRQSWDARPAAAGGQRWFLQYPQLDIPPNDVLHWSQPAQNWNTMCADCHSTGLRKNYDLGTDSYNTTFAELSVGCEACHGPGSNHAKAPASHELSGNATLASHEQPQICAQCHARRSQIAEGFRPGDELLNYYIPALLNPPLYSADGQIDDEVYVYGSFLSSKMAAKGVTCSDCHNPHSGDLVASGDSVCTQCHSPAGNARFASLPRKTYASAEHHQHNPDTAGARCVSCHMPGKTYMGVDLRHDHSLRVPRPDLTLQHGAANACQQCHDDQTINTALTDHWQPRLQAWRDHFAQTWLQQPAQGQRLQHQSQLAALANNPEISPMVRATSLSRLAGDSGGAVAAIDQASRDPQALVRLTSINLLGHLQGARQRGAVKRLLNDPVLAVRSATAAQALNLFEPAQRQDLQPRLAAVLAEYTAIQNLNADRPEAHVNLANVAVSEGAWTNAEQHLQTALKINPGFIPALLNVADVLRQTDRDGQAEDYLLRAINAGVASPSADYAYAMWLVRNGRRELALVHLQRAYRTEPDNPQWLYTYAIALHSLGQGSDAMTLLNSLASRPEYTQQVMFLHANIARDLGATESRYRDTAWQLIERLVQIEPSNPNYQALWRELRPAATAPQTR